MNRPCIPRWCWILPLLLFLVPIPARGETNPGNGKEILAEDRRIVEEEIERILEAHLTRVVNDPRKKIEIRDLRVQEKAALPQGSFSSEVMLSEQACRGGQVSGTVLFSSQGREVRRVRFSARVDLYGEVVVARTYLKKHHEIQEGDIQTVQRNLALLPNDVMAEAGEVLRQRTVLSVNGNEVLRKSMVEVPPLVRKGDRVLMTVDHPFFKITTWGEVKEEGRKGDRVKLVNLSSKKEVYGRVLNGNTVQIDY